MSCRGSQIEFLVRVQRHWRGVIRAARQCLAGRAGFTLIEVLVAIALLALVLGAIGSLFGTTAKGVRVVDRQLPLLETAQNLLASLPERNALRPGTQSGATGDIRWWIDVAPLLDRAADTPASTKWMPLTVTVHVQGSDGPPVRLDTVRLVPRPSG
jgi:general secretion pathway protein I